MSTIATTNLKNPSSANNNIVLGTGGDTTITNNLTVSGTGNHSIAGTLQFNSGYGSAATAYGCRAWVNYNGVTPGIRSSGNVSSVTKNGTGDYTVNFSTAMPDTNYAFSFGAGTGNGRLTMLYNGTFNTTDSSSAKTTGSIRIGYFDPSGVSNDNAQIAVAIFR